MTERRLFCPPDISLTTLVKEGRVTLTAEEAHYARAVLRLVDASEVVALDGTGGAVRAHLHHVGKRDAELRCGADNAALELRAQGRRVHLIMPVAKGERTDWLVEKATEMGVFQITFARCERSVAEGHSQSRWQRWQRLTQAAARQARHGRLPTLSAADSLQSAMNERQDEPCARVIAHVDYQAQALPLAIADAIAVTIIVGPEGGLTPSELQLAEAHGYNAVTLGPHVLRMETAALVALAACVSMPLP